FREEGYDVHTAEDANEALTRMAETKFDAALLDIKMRGTDGIELQKRMHEIDPELIAIMMTGYASVSRRRTFSSWARRCESAFFTRCAQEENVRLRETVAEISQHPDLIGQSVAMK